METAVDSQTMSQTVYHIDNRWHGLRELHVQEVSKDSMLIIFFSDTYLHLIA